MCWFIVIEGRQKGRQEGRQRGGGGVVAIGAGENGCREGNCQFENCRDEVWLKADTVGGSQNKAIMYLFRLINL